jgi:hypothetical protein
MNIAIIPMKWAENPEHRGLADRCSCCGKPLRGKPCYIEVIHGGECVAAPGLGPKLDDSGYMGMFAIGSGCARKHFPGFHTKGAPENVARAGK